MSKHLEKLKKTATNEDAISSIFEFVTQFASVYKIILATLLLVFIPQSCTTPAGLASPPPPHFNLSSLTNSTHINLTNTTLGAASTHSCRFGPCQQPRSAQRQAPALR